ncbi:MAG: fasciclin domain-containing protein, partial [Planctomycetota bacterium]
MIRTSLFLLLIAAAFRPVAAEPLPQRDIVETAVAAESFKVLVTALKTAKLVDALKADGPFTVFAPTDAAFAKLPPEAVAELLKPESRERLQAILTYHVVPGRLEAADLLARSSPTSLNGAAIPVSFRNGRIGIQKASLVKTDIQCANGVIHVIDAVLLPNEEGVLDVAKRAGTFRTLLAAVDAAGLRSTLAGEEAFTVFAPTDEAFAKLPKEAIPEFLKPANRAKLSALLARHVVRGRVTAATALRAGMVKTLSGDSVRITLGDGLLRVGPATLVSADLAARNGLIHVIDRVLLPPTASPGRAARDMLVLAIERGVPEYNAGRASACASIYEVASRAVLAMTRAELSPEERAVLE